MQEKDIKEQLNQELDKMAPDILEKVLAKPIEPIESEEDLFNNEPLFEEKKDKGKYLWIPQVIAVVACLVLVAVLSSIWFKPNVTPTALDPKMATAFTIAIDVNPSITMKVKKDNTVESIKASNKDAKKVVKKVKKQLKDDTTYGEAIEMVVSGLKKKGYLKKDNSAMLVSVVTDDKKAGEEKLKEVKDYTKKVKKDKKVKCATIYQNCVSNEKIKKVAKKNKVSEGKVALCIKIAEKEKVSIKKMCKKSIFILIKQVEKTKIDVEPDIEIDDEINVVPEEPTGETESAIIEETTEIESESSTENMETETGEETSPVSENVNENETIPETVQNSQP